MTPEEAKKLIDVIEKMSKIIIKLENRVDTLEKKRSAKSTSQRIES